MSPAAFGFLVGCVWFGAFMAAHLAILHFVNGAGPTRVLTRVIAVMTLAAGFNVAVVESARFDSFLMAEIYAVLTIACLFVIYAPFFYTIFTSLSIQSLLVIMDKGGRVPTEELIQRYASRHIFKGRLLTMVANGYLTHRDGMFDLTPKGVRLARTFNALNAAWRLGAGG